MFNYEKLGAFYLGKEFSAERGEVTPDFVMYDSKDLTTHAVIVGMTGSGKTGLGIGMLEEAAIDGIPALIIDPKGDMGNLLLNFPNLSAGDFEPWVDPGEATRKGMSKSEFAADRATLWRKGLADWDQEPDRIQKLRDAVDISIYTPGSDAGLQLTILKSLNAPSVETINSSDAMRERVSSAVAGLLTLLGVDADPLRSREHILLSNIVDNAWRQGRDLDMPTLIREIQKPPFQKIGIMDLESIFPSKDRMQLAMTVNNVLASPGFASWTQGEPLNIQNLLYTAAGKPRLTVLSIAHLNDAERMFFVTILLNEVLSWMRAQPGTSSLRALLYMDEVFGYLPPTANPPSKVPMLTLLKQARAFGLGLILSTQNPVDLDYKALSNAGTWFLGRLQTERDKARVLDGLEGASASAGVKFDRQKMEQILSGVSSRVFMLNNVHEDQPVLFHTRWALSYLGGPMTRGQIERLMGPRKIEQAALLSNANPATAPHLAAQNQQPVAPVPEAPEPPPLLPEGVEQRYAAISRRVPRDAEILYRPALLAQAMLHFSDSKSDVDCWNEIVRMVPLQGEDVEKDPWVDSDTISLEQLELEKEPTQAARFAEIPHPCLRKTSYKSWNSTFKSFLYREERLTLNYCAELNLYSTPDERSGDFLARIKHEAHERRDLEIEKIRKGYESKIETLKDRIRKAEQKVAQEQEQASSATMNATLSFGTSILGALFGRKKLSTTNITKAATSMRSAGRASEQRSDAKRAEDEVDRLVEDMHDLEEELEEEVDQLTKTLSMKELENVDYEIKPRKSDISAEEIIVLWLPYEVTRDGIAEAAFE